MSKATCGFLFSVLFLHVVFQIVCSGEYAAPSSDIVTNEIPGPEEGDFIPAFPNPPECGVSNASFNKVVGGENAQLDDFPWMALLGYKSDDGNPWKCGGALISVRHVLTAAHCIHNLEHMLYVVRLGELDISRDDEGARPIDIPIKTMIAHEQYSANTYNDDIGLLILQNDVKFTKSIHPICMPITKELRMATYEDYNPFVAGWGLTKENGKPASNLQMLQLPVLENDACVEAYRSYKSRSFDQRVMCAGFFMGGRDVCKGDSGGPLMQPIWSNAANKSYFYQIGVISYGRGCAHASFPSVFTRVTHFLPWIEKKVVRRQ